MKVLIVGGGAGGASVAARARRLNEHAQIILVDKHAEISQATCGLPYYIGGTISDRDRLVVVDAKDFASILDVDVRVRSEVTAISRDERTVTIRNHQDGTQYKESYDKLVLSPGASPVVPQIPGIHRSNIFTLQSTEDMDCIKSYLDQRRCQTAVVVGAGFIGLEMADNLRDLGISVSIVERARQVMAAIDYEMATLVHQHLQQNGINLYLGQEIVAFSEAGALMDNDETLAADIVILALGMRARTMLAHHCGLEIGERGGIAVDADMRSSDPNIFALGDSVEVKDELTGERTLAQLAGPAHKQASVVAENLFGGSNVYKAGPGTSIAKVFELTVARTGLTEEQLKQSGAAYEKSYVDLHSHANYYPNAFPLTVKLLFKRESGKILGAQIVGSEGVDKRIDVIATAMYFGKTVHDLADLDLAYAPPYSSAKDPVNVAGMVARNMLNDGYQVVYWDEMTVSSDDTVVLDVRTPEEHDIDAIPGSINIPLEHLRSRVGELPTNKRILLYCQQGKKGYFAFRILKQRGFDNVHNLSGGFKLHRAATASHSLSSVETGAVTEKSLVEELLEEKAEFDEEAVSMSIDATGLSCPGPIMRLTHGIKRINDGEFLLITASDPAFHRDVETWCKKTGNAIHFHDNKRSVTRLVIKKRDSL
jgi:NADPH-dependent 2,4-dienoyl-CoA reductase/sulfur reductase-like enzyme/rhodanese-related sulfurtransferase/TusA-related sulfurtransferase